MALAALTPGRVGAFVGAGIIGSGQPSGRVWRADGMNADAANIIPTTGAAQFATTNRERHLSQTPTDVFRILIPMWTFSLTGSVLEIDLPEPYDFALTGEYPFFEGLTGIPTDTRVKAKVVGTEDSVFSYVPGGPQYVVFEVKFPQVVPRLAAYGLWLTQECVAGRSGAVTNKQIMKAQGGSSQIQRNQGFVAVSNPSAGHIATDAGMTLTAVNAPSSSQTGVNVPMGAGVIIVPMPPSKPSILANGNSIEAGNQEGYGASGIFGDASGDQYGNRGYVTRLAQKLGRSVAQLSKGSDRDSYRLTAGNYARRLAMLSVVNPTHVFDMNPHNEIAGITASIPRAQGWSANTSYPNIDVAVALNGNAYILDVAGTSGATGPTGTGTGIVDGDCRWTYIGPDDMGVPGRDGMGWVAQRRKRLRLDRAALPNAKFIGTTGTPDADAAQTSTTYTYSGTTLTITLPSVAEFIVGQNARVQGLSPSGHNSPSNGFSTVTAIDTVNKTVSFTVASGLAAPTGTATVNSEWVSVVGQVPATGFGAGNSARSWINRFLRTLPNNAAVLNYAGIFDLGKYTEAGAPTTPAAETGAWAPILDGANVPIGGAPTYDKTHPTSRGYDRIATLGALDSAVVQLLAS